MEGMAMEIKKANGEIYVGFDEPPKIENRKDAIKILNLLIKADGVTNDQLALKAVRDAIKKGIA
jgi:hypothetical protein